MARPSHCATLSVHGIHRIRRKSCGESVAIVESCDPTGARRDDVHLLRHFPALRVLSRHDGHVPRRFRMESYAASTRTHVPLRHAFPHGVMRRFRMIPRLQAVDWYHVRDGIGRRRRRTRRIGVVQHGLVEGASPRGGIARSCMMMGFCASVRACDRLCTCV